MCVQTLHLLQTCVITVLVGLIVRYLQCSIFCVRISLAPDPTLSLGECDRAQQQSSRDKVANVLDSRCTGTLTAEGAEDSRG